MKKITWLSKPLMAFAIAGAVYSCSNSPEATKEEPKKAADSTGSTATVSPAAPAAFVPFDVVEISHGLKDYAKWKPQFDLDSVNRKTSGLNLLVIGRSDNNPNNVLIVLSASDVQKAKAFSADPRLKDVMTKAGVISKPDIQLLHVIRFNSDSKEKQWVTITHKVKDFDAWVKVYDGEGKEKRAGEGLVDVAIARGIDDPNLVQVVFDITDMAKAKAAITSGEKKKLMTSAGVEGMPKIEFYTSAE